MKSGKITRRNFLKKSIAGTGILSFPLIVPTSVFGDESPSNRITIGMIGCGSQGILNLRAFLTKRDAKIVAVCDVDSKHREEGRKRAGLSPETSYEDFRELLARADIDAVTVSTPDHWHALISIAAAKAGKDIYSEKPFAYSIAEGRALCDTVKKYGCVFQTGSHQRSDKNFRYACELVRNGRIGKLQTIKVEIPENSRVNPLTWKVEQSPAILNYDLWLGPAQYRPYIEQGTHYNWHFIYNTGWGQLTNWGAHVFDIAQWGNGTDSTGPIEVSGTAKFPDEGLFETPLHYDLEYKYENGVRLLCVTTNNSQSSESPVRFEGDEGWIYVSRNKFFSQPANLIQSKIGANEIQLYHSLDHHQNFLDCIKNRTQTAADVETGHRSASICHIGGIAVRLGRNLKWNPQKECFINDEQANRMLARPMRFPWHL